MRYIKMTLIIGQLIAFSSSYSAEESVVTNQNLLTQQQTLLEARFSEARFNQILILPENQNTLQSLNIVNYGDYEQALYNYYSSFPLLEGMNLRSPDNFRRCQNRRTENFLEDVDMVNDYVGHLNYKLERAKKLKDNK